MNNQRFLGIKFGGAGNDQYHDGKLKVKYFNIFSQSNITDTSLGGWTGGRVSTYSDIFSNYLNNVDTRDSSPIIENYTYESNGSGQEIATSEGYGAKPTYGSQNYSIFRREFEVYERPGYKINGYYNPVDKQFYYEYSNNTYRKIITPREGIVFIDMTNNNQYYYSYSATSRSYYLVDRAKIYKGEWEPVALKTKQNSLYDYNVVNGKSYQYIIYPDDMVADSDEESIVYSAQNFANSGQNNKVWKQDSSYKGQGKLVFGSNQTSNTLGEPVVINWDEWSICELIPEPEIEDAPLIKNAYKVNTEQVWLFKYSLETGSQTQNIARSDFQTLGQFPKIGFGNTNYTSGDVSALLGSEIILTSRDKYTERLKKSRLGPISTNEKAKMLEEWKKFVASKNPKLLKDIKGQSWIVQITSGSNTTKNFYLNQPDTINFQWKQVEDTKNVIIYSEIDRIYEEKEEYGSSLWEPIFKNM